MQSVYQFIGLYIVYLYIHMSRAPHLVFQPWGFVLVQEEVYYRMFKCALLFISFFFVVSPIRITQLWFSSRKQSYNFLLDFIDTNKKEISCQFLNFLCSMKIPLLLILSICIGFQFIKSINQFLVFIFILMYIQEIITFSMTICAH